MTLARSVPHWRRIEQALRERIAGMAPGEPLSSEAGRMTTRDTRRG